MKIKAIVICISLAISSFLSAANEVTNISQQQLMSILSAPKSSSYIVLDVRTPEEFAQGHIKGAINISHDQVENNLSKLKKYRDSMVVVHCRSGRRAKSAEAVLSENGFSQLRHLTGDYNGWVNADLPLVKE